MIVSQFQERRYFAGRLDPDQDIVAAFRTICAENRISCGWIHATAVLRHPEFAFLDREDSAARDPETLDGIAFCPTISGNVSVLGDGLDVRLYAAVRVERDGAPGERAGRILSGEVRMCEFWMLALDDVAFVRAPDGAYSAWVQVQAPEDLRARKPVPPPAIQPLVRPPAEPSYRPPDPDEAEELILLEIQPGDYVDHPRFGTCRVVHAPQEDRLTIRLGSGKHVDLHMGVLRVLPGRQAGGRKVYPIELRKRT